MTSTEEKNLVKDVEKKLAVSTSDDNDDGNSSSSNKYDRWTLRDDSTVDYGYFAQTHGAGINDETTGGGGGSGGGFYLTTAINYTNGPAHMGHAYEGTTADVISRYFRLKGDQPCYFVTGADEHGQKIADTAAKDGKKPQEICDKVSSVVFFGCCCCWWCSVLSYPGPLFCIRRWHCYIGYG
jgi:tRNA synthetases class I (M)